jgi:hypothetical protein
VSALVVVEPAAPVQDDSLRGRGVVELVAGEDFPFQGGEERLGGSVVETLTG